MYLFLRIKKYIAYKTNSSFQHDFLANAASSPSQVYGKRK